MKKICIKKVGTLLCLILFGSYAPYCFRGADRPGPPKLVVGIVVDQMSVEQLYKYKEKYTEGALSGSFARASILKIPSTITSQP